MAWYLGSGKKGKKEALVKRRYDGEGRRSHEQWLDEPDTTNHKALGRLQLIGYGCHGRQHLLTCTITRICRNHVYLDHLLVVSEYRQRYIKKKM